MRPAGSTTATCGVNCNSGVAALSDCTPILTGKGTYNPAHSYNTRFSHVILLIARSAHAMWTTAGNLCLDNGRLTGRFSK